MKLFDNSILRKVLYRTLIVFSTLTFFQAESVQAQLSLINTTTTFTEDLNTLPASGSATWTNNSTLLNWYAARSGTGTTIVASTGSSNTGALYSFGPSAGSDRALGSVGSGNAAAGIFSWGIRIKNNTGGPVSSLEISYTGEQWRDVNTTAQTVSFWYKVSNTPITTFDATTSGYTAFSSLDFISPTNLNTGSAGIDGNASGNRVTLTATLNIALNAGDEIMLKWYDIDHTGSDQGLGVDDFSVKANAGAGCTPTQLVIKAINNVMPVNAITANQPFSVTVESRDAGNNPCAVGSNTPISISLSTGNGIISGTINGTLSTGSSITTLSGVLYSAVEGGISLSVDDGPGGLTAGVSTVFRSLGVNEDILPQFIQGINGTNTNRIPYAFRLTLSGLDPNTIYRYYPQADTLDGNPNNNGAGNCIFVHQSGSFNKTTSPGFSVVGNYDSLTTDATGSYSGWFILEPTGNIRFTPDSIINLRIILNNGAGGATEFYRVATTAGVIVKSLVNLINGATGIYSYTNATARNFVMLYDNTAGNGRPLSGTMVEDDGTDNTTNYATFYGGNVDGFAGAWGSLIPNSLAGGLRRIEQRSLSAGTIVGCPATDADGIWPSGVNTINPSGGTNEISLDINLDDPLGYPNATASNNGPVCEGASVTLFSSGGMTYTWTGPLGYFSNQQNPVITSVSGSNGGLYTVTVSDAGGCSVTATTTVTVNAVPEIVVGNDGPVCEGGDVNLASSGGVSFLWNGPMGFASSQQNPLISGILINQAGSYIVTVTGANGCTTSDTSLLVVNPVPDLGVLSPVSNICPASTVDLTSIVISDVNGTTGTLSYYTNQSDAFAGINPLTLTQSQTIGVTGIYYIRKTTAAIPSCFDLTSVNVLINSCSCLQPVLSETHVPVSCFGGSDGSINLTISSGTPPFTFEWSNGSTNEDLTAVPAGNYSVTVTDAQPCTAVLIVVVTEPQPISVIPVSVNPSCFSASNGSVSLQVNGGTPGFSYLWSNGTSTQNQSGLAAGNYSVTITDQNSCTSAQQITLTEPSPLVVVPVTSHVSCFNGNDGTIALTVSGGTPGYLYLWSDGSTEQNRTSLSASTYTVIVTDAANCTVSLTESVSEPSEISITSLISHVNCFNGNDGSIALSVTGGIQPYTYLWSNGATIQNINSGLSIGTYTITVTDQGNCSVNEEYTVLQPSQLQLSSVQNNLACYDGNTGTVDLTVSGGTPSYSFVWSTGSTTEDISGLSSGTYSVTVSDQAGCTATLSSGILAPGQIQVSTSVSDATCGLNNGMVTATVTGGTPAGSNTPGLLISEFLANPAGTDSPFEWVELIATKPVDFATTPYSVIFTNNGTATGKGWVQGAGVTYAFAITTGTVNTGDVVYVGGSSMTPSGTKLRIIATGTTGGDGGIGAANSAGVLGNGGTNADAIGVFNIPLVSLDSNSIPVDAVFFGSGIGSALVNGGSGGYTLPVNDLYPGGRLQGNSFIAPDPGSGLFTRATGSFNIITNNFISGRTWINSAGFTDNSSAVTLTGLPAGDYLFSWSDGSTLQNISSLAPGTYTVTVVDGLGCSVTASTVVSVGASIGLILDLSAYGSYNISCNGNNDGGVDLTASGVTGPFSYTWSNGATTEDLTGLIAGTYTVTVTNGVCTVVTSVVLTEPPAVSLQLTAIHPAVCLPAGGSLSAHILTGSLPYSYLWNTGAVTSAITGLVSGTYTVTVSDGNGCTATAAEVLEIPEPINVNVAVNHINCRGGNTGSISLAITGGTPGYTFLWNNGSTNKDRTGLIAGTYSVLITDDRGCTATRNILVTQPGTALNANINKTNIRCYGANSGVAKVAPFGGVPPYSFAWNTVPVKTTGAITGVPAGVYTCLVTDANNCTRTFFITLTQPPALTAVITQSNVTFPGGNNGTASAAVSGGVPGYQYNWNTIPVQTTASVSGLTAGVYKCTITDSKGCQIKQIVTITEPTSKGIGAGQDLNKLKLKIHPNPTTGYLNLVFESDSESYAIRLMDALGKIVYSKNYHNENGVNNMFIDMTGLPKGIFFLQILKSDMQVLERIILQ